MQIKGAFHAYIKYVLRPSNRDKSGTYPDDVLSFRHLIAGMSLHHLDHRSVESFTQFQIFTRHRTLDTTQSHIITLMYKRYYVVLTKRVLTFTGS